MFDGSPQPPVEVGGQGGLMITILMLLVTFAAIAVMIWGSDTAIGGSITPQPGPVPGTWPGQRPTSRMRRPASRMRRPTSRGQQRRPLGPEDDLEFMRELGRRLGHGDSVV
jgi:hypothetical protein